MKRLQLDDRPEGSSDPIAEIVCLALFILLVAIGTGFIRLG